MLGGLFGGGGGGFNGTSFIGDSGGVNLSGLPFVGGLFPNAAQQQQRQAMADAASAYGAMRPGVAQGFGNIWSGVQQAYTPAERALQAMYGGGTAPNSGGWAPGGARPMPGGGPSSITSGGGPRPSDNSGGGSSPFGQGGLLGMASGDPLGGALFGQGGPMGFAGRQAGGALGGGGGLGGLLGGGGLFGGGGGSPLGGLGGIFGGGGGGPLGGLFG